MIKVSFKEPTECYYNAGQNIVIANFILCNSVSKLKFKTPFFPSIVGNHLYIPIDREYIKSIEHVKPTDL